MNRPHVTGRRVAERILGRYRKTVGHSGRRRAGIAIDEQAHGRRRRHQNPALCPGNRAGHGVRRRERLGSRCL